MGSRCDELIADARSTGHDELIDPILPAGDAPFIFKARHSIFYGSPLEYFLETNGIGRLIMALRSMWRWPSTATIARTTNA